MFKWLKKIINPQNKNFHDLYFGLRPLLSENEILNYIQTLADFNKSGDETLDNKRLYVLYRGNNCKSYLIFTNKRIYKLLDNKENDKIILNWSCDVKELNITEIKTFHKGFISFPNKPHILYNFNHWTFPIDEMLILITEKANKE